ncbi:autoinducer binding domain-containing protein [Pseudomonas sp. S 311-6]|uniref:autoinducer binding domain-containing protein n=1 Tax=Pseudomonas TaxID=286 RepID=UPI001CE4B611|nr:MULTISPECIES: autoinducer binding domain-containing protein [Pseudomonas]MCO7641993.1 autoinducer binding domain-containing protein [Pseudomonas sp. S 311-6]MCO7567006.1 autoinducer binding domain-containing protein [Pseudomonas mosselii]MCO7597088.1 autoinducer binding domain-containing protein [Pseudomonas guariconensis]MCO7618408.1 autoinducer binding domain-containing protein [Pseudomonas guariconensis]MCO7634715.1 autoinducer binding domain-containing protein [Pseudomonas guariconensis
MPQWKTQQLQLLLEEREPQRLFDRALGLVQDLDMTYLGLALYLPIAAHPPQVVRYNNYPGEWNAHCQGGEALREDPVVNRCHRTTMPVLWHDELYHEVPHLRETACSHGLCHGWTQSVHDLQHNETQLSVARPQGAIDTAEFYEKAAQVLWLCNSLHALLCEYHLARLAPEPSLSDRELEVLKWSAAGKTASDIACILSLSTSTVNFHIRSVITKTNAANKAGAIAIAATRGLL